MSTDIHGVFQLRDLITDNWREIVLRDIMHLPDVFTHVCNHVTRYMEINGVSITPASVRDVNSQAFAYAVDRDAFGYLLDRDYNLFGALGGREPVSFNLPLIASSRGLPVDFDVRTQGPYAKNPIEEDPDDNIQGWIGDHSFSWLTSTEMLHWYDSIPQVYEQGVLSRNGYLVWDKVSEPDKSFMHYGFYALPIVIDEPYLNPEETLFECIRCAWLCKDKARLSFFFDDIRLMHSIFGEIRFVFGFDS